MSESARVDDFSTVGSFPLYPRTMATVDPAEDGIKRFIALSTTVTTSGVVSGGMSR